MIVQYLQKTELVLKLGKKFVNLDYLDTNFTRHCALCHVLKNRIYFHLGKEEELLKKMQKDNVGMTWNIKKLWIV